MSPADLQIIQTDAPRGNPENPSGSLLESNLSFFFKDLEEAIKFYIDVENSDLVSHMAIVNEVLLNSHAGNLEEVRSLAERSHPSRKLLEEARGFVGLLKEVLVETLQSLDRVGVTGGPVPLEEPETLRNALLTHYVLMPWIIRLRDQCGRTGPISLD